MKDGRAQLRVLAAALSTAVALTAAYLLPDVPNEIWIAWGGVIMGVFGLAEGIFDTGLTGKGDGV